MNMKVHLIVDSLLYTLIMLCLPRIGPVRAVAIHPSRALLVSGGDDYKIKVWGELHLIR